MLALVTRPEPQASAWAQALRDAGLQAQALPLIGITPPADTAAVESIWMHLHQFRALMFVSPAAVDWFFRLRPGPARWPEGTLATAPGPGTAKELLARGSTVGLTPQQIISPGADAPQFDSETLWPLLAPLDWSGQRVCIISGGDGQDARGRTWLSEQWRQRGAAVQTLLTYQRGPAQWAPAQTALASQALTQPDQHTWLLSSSEAIGFLATLGQPLLPTSHGLPWAHMRILTTHPRIAERAQAMGISQIIQTRPDLNEVVQALRCLP